MNKDKTFVRQTSGRKPPAFEDECMRDTRLVSSGAGAGNWQWYEISPVYEGLAQYLDQIVVHLTQQERSSVNLNHRVQIQYSADGLEWSAGGDIIASQNTEGYTISGAFATRTQFGRFIRLRLGLEDNGTVYSGVFSVWAHFKMWT